MKLISVVSSGTDVVSEHASQHLHKLILKRPEFNEGRYEEAIRGALQDEDNLLLEGFRKGFTEYAHSGCTVTLCLLNLTAGTLISANVGDSHTILADHNVRGHEPAKIVSTGASRHCHVLIMTERTASPNAVTQTVYAEREDSD